MLTLNVLAMLVAFVATIGLFNFILAALTSLFWSDGLTVQNIFAWTQVPFAWLMGIPAEECSVISKALGDRIVFNEFLGYQALTTMEEGLSDRGRTLAAYALCGFANFGSIAIQIGGISQLAPDRRVDLARLGLRSMVAGLLTCYLTAAIVGIIL
ncbi:MAG: hypothetical protein LR011_02060 [Verrucomicrobia bacterium]|nr:hypothetical protein [Verrucomicrobiota bacterium]